MREKREEFDWFFFFGLSLSVFFFRENRDLFFFLLAIVNSKCQKNLVSEGCSNSNFTFFVLRENKRKRAQSAAQV